MFLTGFRRWRRAWPHSQAEAILRPPKVQGGHRRNVPRKRGRKRKRKQREFAKIETLVFDLFYLWEHRQLYLRFIFVQSFFL